MLGFIRVRLGLVLRLRLSKDYLVRLLHLYQAYCTLVVRYCYVTGGV